MKRRLLLFFGLLLIVTINIYFISGAKAYEENAFTDEKCITTTSWMSSAQTAYTLDQSTGTYKLSGQSYNDYKASADASLHVFYKTSGDQKLLYAYVPDYANSVSSQTIKNELKSKGIIVTKDCPGTLVVTKTVVGNPPTEDSYDNVDGGTPGTGESIDNTDTEADVQNDSTTDDSGVVNKIESPNTASPMATAAIIASIALVAVAVYSLLKKTKPELFNRKNR